MKAIISALLFCIILSQTCINAYAPDTSKAAEQLSLTFHSLAYTDESEEETTTTVIKEESKTTQKSKKYLGNFKLTAYCPCSKCCGSYGATTSTGAKPKANHTIAVDPSVIPYGTKVTINGKTYVAEDCGGGIKGNRIDVYFNTHQEALDFGVQYADVYEV